MFFVVGPLLAWGVGSGLRWRALGEGRRSAASRGLAPPSKGGFAIWAGYGLVPVAFGIILWILAQPTARSIETGPASQSAPLDLLLRWAGVAFFAASCTTVAAQELVLHARLPAMSSQDQGRIMVLWVIPLTAVIFALILDLQILGVTDSIRMGTRVLRPNAVDDVSRALGAFSLGTLGFPASAFVSRRIRDLSGRGFIRIILILEAGELLLVLGLAIALSAIGSL